jgi:alginate O-acetyltransferase complex protein AlgI
VVISALTNRLLISVLGVLLLRLLAPLFHSTRKREWLFLIASYLFYVNWGRWFLAVLLFSSIINYALGNYLRQRLTPARLWLGIGCNLLILGFFKYLPLVGTISAHNAAPGWVSRIALPLGISFWTFQAISYLLDLYREEELNPSLLEFCLYMAFWPTVLSGPICRLPEMLPQFRHPTNFSGKDIGQGIQRILTGIFMMAISQLLAVGIAPGQGVDAGFASPANLLGGLDVWCLAIGYGLQLFFNFAGYSHLVIGAALLFNIRLQENFNRPFLSTSPSMFWMRWHMSLSFWIRDYVFFPLATLRREVWWRNLSLVIAMFVFGLWHKGELLLAFYGIYHGLLLVAHRTWQQLTKRLNFESPQPFPLALLSWLYTFGAVSLGWIFFRAETKAQAMAMFTAVLSPTSYRHIALSANFYVLTIVLLIAYFMVVALSALLDSIEMRRQAATSGMSWTLVRDRWVWVVPAVAVLSLYIFLVLHPQGPLVGPMMYQIF